MFLTMKELFKVQKQFTDRVYAMRISFLEIYNETIRDLIGDEQQQQN